MQWPRHNKQGFVDTCTALYVAGLIWVAIGLVLVACPSVLSRCASYSVYVVL
jgi:hypothetical protein